MPEHGNGILSRRSSDSSVSRRKREQNVDLDSGLSPSTSNGEDEDGFGARISDEQYRSMLGEHVQKYRKLRFKSSPYGSQSTHVPVLKNTNFLKFQRHEESFLHEVERSPECYGRDFSEYGGGSKLSSSMSSPYLDIGEGITYLIPPSYDKLIASLKLPSLSDIWVEEYYLRGSLDIHSISKMMASDTRFGPLKRGMGEPLPQYESLQARLKALSTSSSPPKFTLQVCDARLDPFGVPEGAAGRMRRSIMTEAGSLQVFFVKVLEKGESYEVSICLSVSFFIDYLMKKFLLSLILTTDY